MPSDKPIFVVYTDGACYGNPGPGGWAAILLRPQGEQILRGGASYTTNNRMEMRAALAALQALPHPSLVRLHTDSEYLKMGITSWLPRWQRNGWRTASKGRVKNRDLWEALVEAQKPHDVRWYWVKGHAGNHHNTRADELARSAIREIGQSAPPDMESRSR